MIVPWEPIPGETPTDDISGLRVPAKTRHELHVQEANNLFLAALKYLSAKPTPRLAPFDLPWLFRLHREMFGRVWRWAGKTRKTQTNIGVATHQIETQLHNLLNDLRCWETSGMDIAEQAVRLHHRAVVIHPFLNGNGRWARMLANIWLKMHDKPVVEWPEPSIGATSPIREDYLRAIRAADGGDYSSLADLHARFIASAR